MPARLRLFELCAEGGAGRAENACSGVLFHNKKIQLRLSPVNGRSSRGRVRNGLASSTPPVNASNLPRSMAAKRLSAPAFSREELSEADSGALQVLLGECKKRVL